MLKKRRVGIVLWTDGSVLQVEVEKVYRVEKYLFKERQLYLSQHIISRCCC